MVSQRGKWEISFTLPCKVQSRILRVCLSLLETGTGFEVVALPFQKGSLVKGRSPSKVARLETFSRNSQPIRLMRSSRERAGKFQGKFQGWETYVRAFDPGSLVRLFVRRYYKHAWTFFFYRQLHVSGYRGKIKAISLCNIEFNSINTCALSS